MGISSTDLRRAGLFRGLTGCDLTGLLAVARPQQAAAGTTFFLADDQAARCYLLTAGYVKLVQAGLDGAEVVVRMVGPGEIFGWVAVMGGNCYPGTAEAVTDSAALAWDAEAVRRAILATPLLGLNALEAVGRRLREAQDRVRELATERTERRVARTLLRLADQAGTSTSGGVEIAIPVGRQLLADTAGATLHTVSRILAAWDHQGIIGGSRQRIILRQPDRLRALAEDDSEA